MIQDLVKEFNWRGRQRAILKVVAEFCRNENTICGGCGEEFTPDGGWLCDVCEECKSK